MKLKVYREVRSNIQILNRFLHLKGTGIFINPQNPSKGRFILVAGTPGGLEPDRDHLVAKQAWLAVIKYTHSSERH